MLTKHERTTDRSAPDVRVTMDTGRDSQPISSGRDASFFAPLFKQVPAIWSKLFGGESPENNKK